MNSPIATTLFQSTTDSSMTLLTFAGTAELGEYLGSAPPCHIKAGGMLIKLATFGDRRGDGVSLRNNDNVIEVSGLELDYDGGVVPMEEVIATLENNCIEAIVYPSFSYSPDAPRFRVILPFSAPLPPQERLRYAEVANGLFGGILAPESATLSQSYFFQPKTGKLDVHVTKGSRFDQFVDLIGGIEPIKFRVNTAIVGNQAVKRHSDWLAEMLSGADIHGNALRLVARLVQQGVDDATIESIFMVLSNHVAKQRGEERAEELMGSELGRMIEGARIKGYAANTDPAQFQLLTPAEYKQRKVPEWIIKNVLPKAGLVMIYGQSTAGKSFVALDLALSVARGIPWRGHKTNQSRVVYVVAEGTGGFSSRIKAYEQHNQISLDNCPILLLPAAPNLLNQAEIPLVNAINASGGADLIVIDTFAQTTPGANENSSEDMGKALGAVKYIHEETGAMILLVHHAGKDISRGARGWSGLKAAADVEILVDRPNDDSPRSITFEKMKDGVDGEQVSFNLLQIFIGFDADGDEINSCIVDYVITPLPQSKPKNRGRKAQDEFDIKFGVMSLVAEKPRRLSINKILTYHTGTGSRLDASKSKIKVAIEELLFCGNLRLVDVSVQQRIEFGLPNNAGKVLEVAKSLYLAPSSETQ